MEYLFNPESLNVLRSFMYVKSLYAFDYDGTLAPIVNSPEDAVLSETVKDQLLRLSQLVPVAIITGRSVEDVKRFLPFVPSHLIGNHGIEGLQSEEELQRLRKTCGAWIDILSEYMAPYFLSLGLVLENKIYSLSIHYRNSPNPVEAERVARAMLRKLPGVRVVEGKMVFNLVPEKAAHKGTALQRIMDDGNFKFGFFVGDDETDEDVFKLQSPRVLTVRVGASSQSKAKFYIKDQSEIEKLLASILDFHSTTPLPL